MKNIELKSCLLENFKDLWQGGICIAKFALILEKNN